MKNFKVTPIGEKKQTLPKQWDEVFPWYHPNSKVLTKLSSVILNAENTLNFH